MICFMFPGQPMIRTVLPADEALFAEMAGLCKSVSGFDPLDAHALSPDMPESVRLQLYGVTMSLYRHEVLLRQHGNPDLVAEHSLGIYPALAACGCIGSSEALDLTSRIGHCLAAMGKRAEYAFGSVIGLMIEPLTSIAANHGVFIANHNTSHHFLLAGTREAIAAATAEAEAAGAFSVGVFPCDAPLHTPLVQEIYAELTAIVGDYSFREPVVPLVEHIGQQRLPAAEIPDFLVEELCRPVFWGKSCLALRAMGVRRFIEIGHGQALTKFNRWIDSNS